MQIDFKPSPSPVPRLQSNNELRVVADFLSSLSDTDLLIETKAATKTEREATAVVVRYFKEINDRELYLKHACSSLFQFVTDKLGYCAGSAQLRINAMRLIEALPETEAKIESGELSLTAAAKVQSFILLEKKQNKTYSIDEKRELVDACIKKSTCKVERELAKRNPDIQKVESVKPVGRDRFHVSFSISEEIEEKMKKLKGLFAHTNPNMTTEELFERLLELGLEKFDPTRKAERSLRRAEGQRIKQKEQAPADQTNYQKQRNEIHAHETDAAITAHPESQDCAARSSSKLLRRSRRVPAITAKVVWLRNQNRGCEFIDEVGQRCGSQHALQLDHIEGFALGGSHQPENLRVLCAKHNRFVWRLAFAR